VCRWRSKLGEPGGPRFPGSATRALPLPWSANGSPHPEIDREPMNRAEGTAQPVTDSVEAGAVRARRPRSSLLERRPLRRDEGARQGPLGRGR
jgi:hypothetical protein